MYWTIIIAVLAHILSQVLISFFTKANVSPGKEVAAVPVLLTVFIVELIVILLTVIKCEDLETVTSQFLYCCLNQDVNEIFTQISSYHISIFA